MTLLPQVIDVYKANLEKLHTALSADAVDPEVVSAFRNVLDCIVIQPTGYRQPYVVDAYGRLSAIMGVNLFPTARSGQEIVAEEGLRSTVNSANQTGQVQRGNTCR